MIKKKTAKNSKEYDAMLFEYIERELRIDKPKKKTTKKEESVVLNEKR